MSKRFMFLISFILVLGLSGVVQAGTPIIVDNNSFEYDCNGVEVTCHVGHDVDVGSMCDGYIAGWRYLKSVGVSSAWVGVDVNCGWEDPNCDNCHDWIEYPDGNANLYFQGSASVHQILDHNLAYGKKYTATVDLMAWDPIVVQFFSPNDVCAPDVNHFLLNQTVVTPDVWQNPDSDPPGRYMYERDIKHTYVVTDESLVGRKLGIKIGGDYLIGGTDTSYLWADHVRLEWDYASNAYDPDPPDEAEDVNYLGVTLSWLPGLWAVNDGNGHEVYFGTSWDEVNDANTSTEGVYRGSGVGVVSGPDVNNRYSYVVPGGDLPLALGGIYYWRIDEVNDNYVGPVPKPWKGDVWSFTVEGRATNPYPADGEVDVPFLNLTLRWTAGTDSTSHDVYFSSNYANVDDANTSTSSVYRGNKAVTYYLVPESTTTGLTAGQTYYWRIDERSAGNYLLKGKIWGFTVGEFAVVDDFDGYANNPELYAVWDDYWTNGTKAEIFIETGDPNFIHDGNSLRYKYTNTAKSGANYLQSRIDANDPAELEVGKNWTVGGVKSMTLYFLGDATNTWAVAYPNGHRLWVQLREVGTDVKLVQHTDVNDMNEPIWHEWNIPLKTFSDAGVNLSNLDCVSIGIGGTLKAGQSKAAKGQIHLDDIRLYPPRCMPESGLSSVADFTGDCVVDYCDLDIMATDWLLTDGNIITETQDGQITMAAGEPNWTTGHINGALGFDPNIKVDVSDPLLTGSTALSITAWVKRNTDEGYVGLVSSRETWTTEMTTGSTGASVGYCWNDMTKTWMFDSGLVVPDNQWTFVAISADPTGCTMYAKPSGGTLSSSRQTIVLEPLSQTFDKHFWIGRGYEDARFWIGGMDDVRIYNYNLDDANMAMLAAGTGEPSPCPVYLYKFDETSGLVAADSGCGTEFYAPVQSIANLTDPEPQLQRAVNFRDYEILANDWLQEFLWPPE
jgi:hypothetical protein